MPPLYFPVVLLHLLQRGESVKLIPHHRGQARANGSNDSEYHHSRGEHLGRGVQVLPKESHPDCHRGEYQARKEERAARPAAVYRVVWMERIVIRLHTT